MAQAGASHSFVMCVLNTVLAGLDAAYSFLWLDTSVVECFEGPETRMKPLHDLMYLCNVSVSS